MSAVLWKSDSMAVALTARNIGLKVRWTVMTPDEYRQKHKRCATCVYYEKNNKFFQALPSYYCLAKNKTTFDSKGRFCKVYKAKDFKGGQRISGQNTQG
jgi:hypothetical protein